MRDALKSYLALASGITDVTRQRALNAAKALVSQGEATAEQVSTLAEDLLVQSRSNREAVTALVKYEVDRTLGRLGLAASDEVTELSRRVRALEAEIRGLTLLAAGAVRSHVPSGSERMSTPAAPVKKAPAKKAAVKAAKKAAKRAPAKKAAKKTTARKSAAKKTTAKKTTARKSAAKKTTARKSAAKRKSS